MLTSHEARPVSVRWYTDFYIRLSPILGTLAQPNSEQAQTLYLVLERKNRVVVHADPGAGKSVIGAKWLESLVSCRQLVLVPSKNRTQLIQHIKFWCPNASITEKAKDFGSTTIRGMFSKVSKLIYVCTYEALARMEGGALKALAPDAILCDEGCFPQRGVFLKAVFSSEGCFPPLRGGYFPRGD